ARLDQRKQLCPGGVAGEPGDGLRGGVLLRGADAPTRIDHARRDAPGIENSGDERGGEAFAEGNDLILERQPGAGVTPDNAQEVGDLASRFADEPLDARAFLTVEEVRGYQQMPLELRAERGH